MRVTHEEERFAMADIAADVQGVTVPRRQPNVTGGIEHLDRSPVRQRESLRQVFWLAGVLPTRCGHGDSQQCSGRGKARSPCKARTQNDRHGLPHAAGQTSSASAAFC